MTSTELKAKIAANPGTSYWLKNAFEALSQRDPVDALLDIDILQNYCDLRLREIESEA